MAVLRWSDNGDGASFNDGTKNDEVGFSRC